MKGKEGPFHSPSLRSALRLAVRASTRPRRRNSKQAVTRDVLDRLRSTCRSDRLADTRDRGILLLAFASPPRGGSAAGRAAQRRNGALDPRDPKSERLPCSAIQLGRTKTGVADEAERVLLVGPPVEALRKWLEPVDVSSGPIFRSIDHWEALEERALTPRLISDCETALCLARSEAGVFCPRPEIGLPHGGVVSPYPR